MPSVRGWPRFSVAVSSFLLPASEVLLVSKQIFFFSATFKQLVCEMTFYIFSEVKPEPVGWNPMKTEVWTCRSGALCRCCWKALSVCRLLFKSFGSGGWGSGEEAGIVGRTEADTKNTRLSPGVSKWNRSSREYYKVLKREHTLLKLKFHFSWIFFLLWLPGNELFLIYIMFLAI